MDKSAITLSIILFIIISGALGSYIYTNKIIEKYKAELDYALAHPEPENLKKTEKGWEEDKSKLMLLSNHRDIESVSTALIRGCSYAEQGMKDMAVQEIAVARFMLTELIEREKISFENIF